MSNGLLGCVDAVQVPRMLGSRVHERLCKTIDEKNAERVCAKLATISTLAPAPKTPLPQQQSTVVGMQPVASWRRPADTCARPLRRRAQAVSTLRTLQTAPEPPRNMVTLARLLRQSSLPVPALFDSCKDATQGSEELARFWFSLAEKPAILVKRPLPPHHMITPRIGCGRRLLSFFCPFEGPFLAETPAEALVRF